MFIVAFDTNGRLIFIKRPTRKHYYHTAKINAHNKQVLQWNKSLQELHSSLSQYHFKTSDPDELGVGLVLSWSSHQDSRPVLSCTPTRQDFLQDVKSCLAAVRDQD